MSAGIRTQVENSKGKRIFVCCVCVKLLEAVECQDNDMSLLTRLSTVRLIVRGRPDIVLVLADVQLVLHLRSRQRLRNVPDRLLDHLGPFWRPVQGNGVMHVASCLPTLKLAEEHRPK